MSNVLSEEKKQQAIALGKLGWSLRRIEEATGVRRETVSAYLKTAGVRQPGWERRASAKPAMQVTTDPDPAKPAIEVTTDSGGSIREGKDPLLIRSRPPVPANHIASWSNWDCVAAGMPWPSGKT
jgi:hypothetical protein